MEMSFCVQTSSVPQRDRTSAWWLRGMGAAAAVTILAASFPAQAQDAKARAQQLFQEGVDALDKGDSATGCAKLRESLELFAVSNTLFLVAECDQQEGKPIAALGHLQRGLALLDANDERMAMIKERIEALKPKVPRLRVVIPEGQGSTTVWIDGRQIDTSALETPMQLEGGKHTLVFRVPGRQDRTHELELAPGERTEVVATAGPPIQDKPVGKTDSGLRTGGFVALGIGGAGLLTAGITGIVALGRRSDAIKNCPEVGGVPTCPASYQEQLDSDKSLLVGNGVAWGIGIAGVATGAVLLVLSNRGGAKQTGFVPAPFVVNGGIGLGFIGEL